MTINPGPVRRRLDSVGAILKKSEEVVSEGLRKTLNSLAVSFGEVIIQKGAKLSVLHDTTEAPVFHVGRGGLFNKWVLQTRRDDGSIVFEIGTTTTGDQYGAERDRAGNVVRSDDALSGVGLARPWLSNTISRAKYASWESTTSATYETLYNARVHKTHSKVLICLRHTSDLAGTTGSYQVVVASTGLVLGSGPVGFAQTLGYIGPVDLPGGYYTELELKVQALRTAGAGTIFVEVDYVRGVQS